MLEVDSGSFAQEVLQSEKPVVVDFWGPRCAPCLALMPQVEKLEAACADKAKFVKVDASKNRRLCLELRVMSLPTYLCVARLAGGEIKVQDIEQELKKIVGGGTES